MRDKGWGSCCQSCSPKKTVEERGHVLGSMAEPACRAVALLPRVLQAALGFILTFTTMLVPGFSSTNPAVSLAQLGTHLCLRGETKEILSQIFPFSASPPHYLQSHTAPHPKVFIVLWHPLQRQSSGYRARHGSKLKGNPAKYLPPTDSTSPAGNAECPAEVPGAELSRSALNKGQGHCQRILRNVINPVLIPGTVSARPVLNG